MSSHSTLPLTQTNSVDDEEFQSRLTQYGAVIEPILLRLCRNCPELLEDARQEAWLTLSRLRLENAILPATIIRRAVGWRVIDFLKKYNPRSYCGFDKAWRRGYRFEVDKHTGRPVLRAHRRRQRGRRGALDAWLY